MSLCGPADMGRFKTENIYTFVGLGVRDGVVLFIILYIPDLL